MDSYNYGYEVAEDQRGLAVDCDYLFQIAETQRPITSRYWFL